MTSASVIRVLISGLLGTCASPFMVIKSTQLSLVVGVTYVGPEADLLSKSAYVWKTAPWLLQFSGLRRTHARC